MASPNLLPATQSHDLTMNPTGPDMRSLSPEAAVGFVAIMDERLSGMANILSASPAQSLDAMEGAALGIDMVTEALAYDPQALDAIGKYRGPLSEMAQAAGRAHTHQTGHPHPETYFLDSSNMDVNEAFTLLEAIKQKTLDRQWDGTHASSREADAITAHSRKATAIAAANALKDIAAARGQAVIAAETVDKMGAYINKPGPRY